MTSTSFCDVCCMSVFFSTVQIQPDNHKNRNPINSFFFFADIWSNIKPHLQWRFLYVFLHFTDPCIMLVTLLWVHVNCVTYVLQTWYSVQSPCYSNSTSIRLNLRNELARVLPFTGGFRTKHHSPEVMIHSLWKSCIFSLGFSSLFTRTLKLTSSSNMLRESYDLYVCGIHSVPNVDFYFNLLAWHGMRKSVSPLLLKTTHLDKSFSATFSLKILFLRK